MVREVSTSARVTTTVMRLPAVSMMSRPGSTCASVTSGMKEMGGTLANQVVNVDHFSSRSQYFVAANAGCNILKNCHENAMCMYTEASDEFFCRFVIY